MAQSPIFISHATKDDAFLDKLRQKLEGLHLSVWADSRTLRAGDKLPSEIEAAIEHASHVIVVLSPNALNSSCVQREVRKAQEAATRRKADGYRVIPLLFPAICCLIAETPDT